MIKLTPIHFKIHNYRRFKYWQTMFRCSFCAFLNSLLLLVMAQLCVFQLVSAQLSWRSIMSWLNCEKQNSHSLNMFSSILKSRILDLPHTPVWQKDKHTKVTYNEFWNFNWFKDVKIVCQCINQFFMVENIYNLHVWIKNVKNLSIHKSLQKI